VLVRFEDRAYAAFELGAGCWTMNPVEEVSTSVSWYVLFTNPRQEDRANQNLAAWSVERLLPKIKTFRYNEFTRDRVTCPTPLFPRYLFARFDPEAMLHKVRYTRGVHSIVSFGNGPARVDDRIIEVIQSRTGADGFVRTGHAFKPGDEVVINDGPLRSFVGIFEHEVSDSDRVMILLKTLSYQAHTIVDKACLSKPAG